MLFAAFGDLPIPQNTPKQVIMANLRGYAGTRIEFGKSTPKSGERHPQRWQIVGKLGVNVWNIWYIGGKILGEMWSKFGGWGGGILR